MIILIGCGKKQEKQYPLREDITQSVYASGTIKSKSQYEVYSKVSGIIESILVKEGDVVAKGQTIIQLANTAQSLNYENAKQNALFNSTLYKAAKLKLDDIENQINFQNSQTNRSAAISAVTMNDFIMKSQVNGKVYTINKQLGE